MAKKSRHSDIRKGDQLKEADILQKVISIFFQQEGDPLDETAAASRKNGCLENSFVLVDQNSFLFLRCELSYAKPHQLAVVILSQGIFWVSHLLWCAENKLIVSVE